ncbi:hypothetical protein [Methanothermobacter tenebrarum]
MVLEENLCPNYWAKKNPESAVFCKICGKEFEEVEHASLSQRIGAFIIDYFLL